MKRIFIGGIGRSGTTILLHALYRHGEIYTVPIETKFLVEEDGFDDLIAALTHRFSPTGAATAFTRFQDLMFRQVTGLADSKFLQQRHVPAAVFEDYQQALDDFMFGLREDARFFPDRSVLLDLTRRFIASLFDTETRRSDKWVWAEKTPTNYWRLPFLRELWPDCYFVHAIRDPRAIFLSLMERGWLPADLHHSMALFESQMDALVRLRGSYIKQDRFIEVRLENLVEAPRATLDNLARALEMAPFTSEAVAQVVQSMRVYYADKASPNVALNAEDHDRLNALLLPMVTELGYPPCWQPYEVKVGTR